MAKVTGFECADERGQSVACEAHGNNVAFRCTGRGGPVLAVIRDRKRGSGIGRPSECKGCGIGFWLESDEPGSRLVVHRAPHELPSKPGQTRTRSDGLPPGTV